MVDERLQRGRSITQIAAELGSSFNEIWKRFRSNPQLPRKYRIHIWLDREDDSDASKRLDKLWPQILKAVTSKQSIAKDTPSTLAIRWGIKPHLIANKLREEGLMESANRQVIQEAATTLRNLREWVASSSDPAGEELKKMYTKAVTPKTPIPPYILKDKEEKEQLSAAAYKAYKVVERGNPEGGLKQFFAAYEKITGRKPHPSMLKLAKVQEPGLFLISNYMKNPAKKW